MQLTEQQFMEQYGEAKVTFTSYYKYSFSFVGEFEGKKISIVVGGTTDDIYRFAVEANEEYQVKEFCVTFATVKEGETTIAKFSEGW